MANPIIKQLNVNNTLYDIQPFGEISETIIPATIARVSSPAFSGTPTAPTPTSTDNSTKIATTEFVKTAINGIAGAANALTYKGTIGTEFDYIDLPNSHKVGDTYKIAESGTYAGQECQVGDMAICIRDGTTASDSDWNIIQVNESGEVSGPNSSVNNNIVTFNGTTGKVIKDSGKSINTSISSSSTDNTIPTSKAVYDYIDNQSFVSTSDIGAAGSKDIISDISNNPTSTDLPTAAAVYNYVESKSYDDTKVTQSAAINTNSNYPIILGYSTATNADVTNTVNTTSTLKYNPSSKKISTDGSNFYIIGAAAEKDVDTSLSGKSNSTNLPTSKAIFDYGFVTENDVADYLSTEGYLKSGDITDSDEKVKQTNTSTSNTYNLLFSYSTNTTGEKTEGTRKSSNLTYNPSTKALNIGSGGTINGYSIGAACGYNVSTSVSSGDNNLVTADAVYNYISTNASDTKVTQTTTTSSYYFPILLANTGYSSSTASISTETGESKKATGLRYSPNNNNLIVGKVNNVTLSASTTSFTISGGTSTSKTLTINTSYTLGAACSYGVDTSSSNITSSSTNLPTSAAVYDYINGLGLTSNITDVKAPYSTTTAVTKVSNGIATLNVASTSYYGLTKLSSSTSSTSTSLAATPSAVKEAYDLANTASSNASTAASNASSAVTTANNAYNKGVEYIDSGTYSSGIIGGTISDTAYTTGKLYAVKLASATTATNHSVQFKNSSNTNLASKNLYAYGTTRSNAVYPAGTVLLMVYNGTYFYLINPFGIAG